MEFDFLPKLPKANLDDRDYQQLVEECLLRIPRYCPEWTNHNPSDPGITLIELFAWLTDQMLVRFNQVPRRNYVAFLELLGIRLQAATPAQTDVTFYLSAALGEPYEIPIGSEVATIRTETEEAIVFSTDRPLNIGCPRIRHFLTEDLAAPSDPAMPNAWQQQLEQRTPEQVRDRLTDNWRVRSDGQWEGRELSVFNAQPQPGNCFYLVIDSETPIDGNVIALTFQGEAATPTGINPDAPPRQWQAWNGTHWEPVLLHEADDGTRGFSFHELAQQGVNPLQGADVVLHLPQNFPTTQFTTYRGCWLRCLYNPANGQQSGYTSSPRIVGMSVRAIGGSISASQSTVIENELLGESNGIAGQAFQFQGTSILPRREGEYILVTPPSGLPQQWTEVSDFSESGPNDLHYTIDSLTGIVQFGPLIREPAQLKQQTQVRTRIQNGNAGMLVEAATLQALERQYGAVPPRGSTIRMTSYRVGGGQKGNVQRGTLRILKSAIPYVARVTNHIAARNGADAESLEDAVIRVPRLLRTRDRAVTCEDFETLALQAGRGAVARALCPVEQPEAGSVRLLLVPDANREGISRGEGIHPSAFELNAQLQEQVLRYLDDRKLLGVQVRLEKPEYVGVAVQTEVALEPEYEHISSQILAELRVTLYRFLNPLTGGFDGKGWTFGRPVYPSDIVTLFQQNPYVRYLGVVQLFEMRRQSNGSWERTPPTDPVIDPGPFGLICSWADRRSRHVINRIQN